MTESAAPVTEEFRKEITARVKKFTGINNLILDTDYYRSIEQEDAR